MDLSSLDRLARRQHGVIARRQTDISSSSWRRAIESGHLIAMHHGVARLVGSAATPSQAIMAAVLAAGPGALASHRSAAHLHGVPSLHAPRVHVLVPACSGAGRPARASAVDDLESVVVHRQRDVSHTAAHWVGGIPCTNILRTLVDLGAVAPSAVRGAVGHALTNDLASLDAIESALDSHAERGHGGCTALRSAIDDWSLGAKPADSVLEPAMARLVATYGLPRVEFRASVGGRHVDFLVAGTPIVIECDGWRSHGRDRERLERDRSNDAEFRAHGWTVLRFTYRKITTRPFDVARRINDSIERWAGRPHPGAA